MQWFLYLIGIIWIAYGCWAVLYSFETREGIKLLFTSVDRRLVAALPVIFGLLLTISAAWSDHAWFVRLIGLLAIISGVLIFLNPEKLWDKFTSWYTEYLDVRAHRVVGIVAAILGTAIICWVQ